MIDWLAFVSEKIPLLIQKLFQQVYLTLGSILVAMIISIPLGIAIARKEKIRDYVLGFNSVLQTLPSLAVLGFLLPFLGIGAKTALVTLVLYAMLPIIRNTVTGLLGIPADLLEAADGLGLTKSQKMRLVELPLALPVIVAGIRTATAMTVGIATLAAFIGAGGLGDFIYEGLSLNNMHLILLGAIPAALLALSLDYLIAKIEKWLAAKKDSVQKKRRNWVYGWVSCALFMLLVFFIFVYSLKSNPNRVIIGTKNFSEQLILGELLAQTVEKKTQLQVIRKFNLGGTFVCHHAIVSGQIDLYPEYTGTSYAVILKQSQLKDPTQVYNYVKAAYQQRYNLIWLGVFGFNNSNAVAVSKAFSRQYHIITLSDLTKLAPRLTIGVPPDFLERPDGFLGLKETYHLHFGSVRLMDPGLMYQAIYLHQLDAIMAFSTDARIIAYNLFTLKDDRHLFPPYFAAPIVRGDVLKKHPEIASALNLLTGKINNQVMQHLNYQVDVLKKSPHSVARLFLKSNGIL
jgi:osmoprotectant transport system permease protein